MSVLSRRVFYVLVAALVPASIAAAEEPAPLRMLFIGNSYTSVNDLPGMLGVLARAGGLKLETHRSVRGGFTLQKHWEETDAVKRIAAEKWDLVVLQEQSQRPIQDPKAMYDFARRFNAEIRTHGARTLFYLTWCREQSPENQAHLNEAYFTIADELGAGVAPVGIAWRKALAADPQLELYAADMSHPSKTGTYLAACVFYATLAGKSPEGLSAAVAELSAEEALPLQRIAWQTVQELKKSPAAKVKTP